MADSGDNHHKLRINNGGYEEGYFLSGKLMLSSIVILFAAVVFVGALHLIFKRYIRRLRRRNYERRRDHLVSRSQILMYFDNIAGGDHGLDRQVLNCIPMYYYTPKPDRAAPVCTICLSEFEYKDVVRLLPQCNHCFHLECIDTWFQTRSTCPVCRSSVEQVAGAIIRPVWKLNVPEPAEEASSGCEQEEGSGDGDSAAAEARMELVEVRVEMPPCITAVENEISQNAVADQLSLTRIKTVEKLPAVFAGHQPGMSAAEISILAAGTVPPGSAELIFRDAEEHFG